MSDQIAHVSDAAFESEVLQADESIIVTFWADWCGPCSAVSAVLEELADSYDDGPRVLLVDVDDNPQTPSYYGITSIPTFLRFTDGEVVERIAGAAPKSDLEELFRGG